MTNRKLGNSFEQELCEFLAEKGFWSHNLTQNQAGQPADIIAVRNKVAHLIDAKVCSNDEFKLSRVEENQVLAMERWLECGNGQGWFALKVQEEVYMLPYFLIKAYSSNQSALSYMEIRTLGKTIGEWIKRCK